MTTPLGDGSVADFMAESGRPITASDRTGSFGVHSSQVDLVVREDGGTWTVEMIERGASNGLLLVTSDVEVLRLFLVLWAGPTWRSKHGLPFLPTTHATPSNGYSVEEDPEGESGVRGPDGQWIACGMFEGIAHELAVAVGHPVDDVIASYKDRNGSPVFTPARRWRLW